MSRAAVADRFAVASLCAARGKLWPAQGNCAHDRMAAAAIEELLKKAQASRGGPAAEAYRKAAQLTRERGDLLGAVELYERADRRGRSGPGRAAAARDDRSRARRALRERARAHRPAMASYERAFKIDPDNAARHRRRAARLSRARRLADGGAAVRGRAGDGVEPRPARRDPGGARAACSREKLATGGRRRCGSRRRCGCGRTTPSPRRRWPSLYISPDFPMAGDDEAQLGARGAAVRRARRRARGARRRRGADRVPAARARRRSLSPRGGDAPRARLRRRQARRTSCGASIVRARRCRGGRSSWPSWPSTPATPTRRPRRWSRRTPRATTPRSSSSGSRSC